MSNLYAKPWYPVGAILEFDRPMDMTAIYGGTWELFGAGRMTVGIDTGDADFNSAGKTVTLSYSVGGTVYSYTMEDFGAIWMQDNEPLDSYCVKYTNLTDKDDINFIVIQYKLKANQSVTIDWVRLEYGDHPTKHIAEDISLAYLRCARYIMAINIKNRIAMTNAGGTTLSYPIDTPVPMDPSLTITGIKLPVDVSFRFNGSAKKTTWKSMTVNRISDNNLGISIALETALPQLYVGYTADAVSFIIDGTPTE